MDYVEVIRQLNDILRRSDNDQNIVLNNDDIKAIEESKIAVARLIGFYPEDFEYKK